MSLAPTAAVYLVAAAALFAVGFFGLMSGRHVLQRILAVNVMGTGVFVVFVAIADGSPGAVADPVPHAMVLTGIVVAVCGTGLALAIARRARELSEGSGGVREAES
jgi:multicomponent Na+:H+ antiporter subunit C